MVVIGSRLTGTHTPASRAERWTNAGMPNATSAATSTSWMRTRSSAAARRYQTSNNVQPTRAAAAMYTKLASKKAIHTPGARS